MTRPYVFAAVLLVVVLVVVIYRRWLTHEHERYDEMRRRERLRALLRRDAESRAAKRTEHATR